MPVQFTAGRFKADDNAGDPLVGGLLYTYASGTTTPKATYTSSTLGTANTNPVALDARGEAQVWLGSGAYTMVLKTAAGVTVWSVDGVENASLATQIDVDDGSSGSLFTTLQGFVTYVLTTALASAASFIQFGVAAVTRTLQDKSRETISAKDFGADNSGDDTAPLLAAFTYAISQGRPLVLSGAYTVSGPITPGGAGGESASGSGSLHIICDGDVMITVSGSATPFNRLITNYTSSINSATISGGRLTLDLANKCACGIYVRHSAAANGGQIDFGPVKIVNVYEAADTGGMEICGIQIYGRYESISLDHPVIDGIDRTVSGHSCKGISISDAVGQVTITSPSVSRVKCTSFSTDADGISVFGYATNGVYGWREGTVQIIDPVFNDNQGRSIKIQASDVTVHRPRVYRRMVVSIGTAEFDFQVGGDIQVLYPYLEYRKNGAVSPLAANFYPLSFQARNKDRGNCFTWKGGTLRSEVALPTFALVQAASDSTETEVTIDGLELQSLGGLGAMFTTCFVNPYADQIQTMSARYHIDVRNVRGNISGVPWIGTSGATSATASNFSWSITDCENTGAASSATKLIETIGGSAITSFRSFLARDNVNTSDYLGTVVFDYRTLPVGLRFNYDTATSTATNKPASLPSTGVAMVEVLSQFTGLSGYRSIRVTHGNASTSNTVFYTQDGTAWGTIK
jgi:hypothetical protein